MCTAKTIEVAHLVVQPRSNDPTQEPGNEAIEVAYLVVQPRSNDPTQEPGNKVIEVAHLVVQPHSNDQYLTVSCIPAMGHVYDISRYGT